jgi:hypothetical protein
VTAAERRCRAAFCIEIAQRMQQDGRELERHPADYDGAFLSPHLTAAIGMLALFVKELLLAGAAPAPKRKKARRKP